MSATKDELLQRLPRGPMRTAHRGQTVRFIRGSIREWEEADDCERADIMAFFKSDGPVKIAAVKRLLKSGHLKTS